MAARIQNYLLEKSRVASVSKRERTFHVFYYLMYSVEREEAGLMANEKYEYLEASGCMAAEGIDDVSNFNTLKAKLLGVGFDKQILQRIWKTLGAILLLGNL